MMAYSETRAASVEMVGNRDESVAFTIRFETDDFEWRPFLRQAFIASSGWVIYFTMGVFLGSPTTIIPQMRREANSTAISDEMVSWLSSAFCYSAIPWVFILPNLARVIGRKKTIIIVALSTILTFIVFYFSTTPIHLLISEIVIGVTHASIVTVNVIVISEYTSPKYRGMFLTFKSASLFWGIWISNAIGTYCHWSNIPMFGLVCSLYSLTVLLWPESPNWLASKKSFVECRRAHRWLKGTSEKSEAELDKLITFHSNDKKIRLTNFKFVKRKEFYMPLFLSVLAVSQYHFSGKFVITVYAIDIMKKIMNSESSAYKSMLILDGVSVLAAYIGCITAKLFNRRTVLLTASGLAITFLLIMSFYLYLIKLSLIAENTYLSLSFLACFCISINCGPMIMATSLYGELIPVRFTSICIIIIALVFFILHGTLLKVSPLIFRTLGMPGTFLFYGLSSAICASLMYVYLPETKDKTLLEIEEYFKDDKSVENRCVEENKQLVRPSMN